MRIGHARLLATATITAALLSGCTAGDTASHADNDAGDTASHADDDAMLKLIAPVNTAAEAFHTAEVAWQSNPDPNGGIDGLTRAASDAAAAHHAFADQVGSHSWISQAAALALAVGPAFDDLGDAFDALTGATDIISASIGDCKVSIAGLAAKQAYSEYIEGVTGNPPTGRLVDEIPIADTGAQMCRHRIPLLKATGKFDKSMAAPDSNLDAIRALKAMAKADDTLVAGVTSERWSDEVDPSVTGMVAAYRSESRHLKDTADSLLTGTQAQVDREFAQLRRAFGASQAAESAFGTALVSWQEHVLQG